MIRASSPNCAVAGTSELNTRSATAGPSVSLTKWVASSQIRVEIGQPRPPRDEHGNAENADPFRNKISSSDTVSTIEASIGLRSAIDAAERTTSRACFRFVATHTV